jgi:hypothetical protein
MMRLATLQGSSVEWAGCSTLTAELSVHLGRQLRYQQPGFLTSARLPESKQFVAALIKSGDRET